MSSFPTSLFPTASPANLGSHIRFSKAGSESGDITVLQAFSKSCSVFLPANCRVLAQTRTAIRKLVAWVSVVFAFWMSYRIHFSSGTTNLLLLALQVVQEGSTLTLNEIKRCVSPHY